MIHLGIDLHKDYSHIFSINPRTEETTSVNLPNDEETIREYIRGFDEPLQGVVEATWNWEWLVYFLQEEGVDMKLANPLQLKMNTVARAKTDRSDARMLAELDRVDFIPECHISARDERGRLKVVRHRNHLLKVRTITKNRIHATLAQLNLRFSGLNMFGLKGRDWLRQLDLPSPEDRIVRSALVIVDLLNAQIGDIDRELMKWADIYPEVKLLQTVPGIGPTLSTSIFAETCSAERFKNADKYVSYCGLVPRVHSSGGKTHHKSPPKNANRDLKYAYTQAVMLIVRSDPAWRIWKKKLLEKKSKSTIRLIMARKLAKCCYKIMRYGTDYREMISKGYLNL